MASSSVPSTAPIQRRKDSLRKELVSTRGASAAEDAVEENVPLQLDRPLPPVVEEDQEHSEGPIRTTMEVHDRYVVELKIKSGPDRRATLRSSPTGHVLPFMPGRGKDRAADSATVEYSVDAWLFFPRSFGIHKDSYSGQSFFNDSKALLRREPTSLWDYDPVANRSTDELDDSPLRALKATLNDRIEADRAQVPECAQDVLHLGGVLRKSIKQMRRILNSEHPLTAMEASRRVSRLSVRLSAINQFLGDFRSFRQSLRYIPHIVHPAYADAALTVDEAASYILEDGLSRLDKRLGELCRDIDDESFVAKATQMKRTLSDAAIVELSYRKRQGFCIHGLSHTGQEYFLYRVGQLKKAMDRVLYFDLRAATLPNHVKHIIGGIGAALAATWAFFAQIQPGHPAAAGLSTLLLLGIGVFAYILKDRIKDITKQKLNHWLNKRQPDRHSKFSPVVSRTSGRIVGELDERVRWVSEVSPVIEAIRDSGHVVDVRDERNESVLRYTKDVRYTIEEHEPEDPINVRDLLRFSVKSFLDHLDDPVRRVSYFDAESEKFTSSSAPKVYHLNLVLQIDVIESDIEGNEVCSTTWERLRIILNRKGIVRLEPVLERGEHSWLTDGLSKELADG